MINYLEKSFQAILVVSNSLKWDFEDKEIKIITFRDKKLVKNQIWAWSKEDYNILAYSKWFSELHFTINRIHMVQYVSNNYIK